MNSNAFLSSSPLSAIQVPKSFPIPLEDRDDFFSVDPKSFTIDQLNAYKKEIVQLMKLERLKLKEMRKYAQARIKAYHQGLRLAGEAMKNKVPSSPSLSSSQVSTDYLDPKTLTSTQLQLYIQGITEELLYEKTLLNESESESKSRLDAYQTGLTIANCELSLRKEK